MTTLPGNATQQVVARHWINGQWHDSEQHGQSIDPATGHEIGRYAKGMAGEAAAAVAAAHRAFLTTDWKSNRELRARVLHEMAERFEARAADLQALLSLENGKVAGEAMFEISLAAPGLRYCAGLIFSDYGRAAQWSAGRFSMVLREPLGVAGISVPWNSPVALMVRSLAPALAAGCTTVIKMPSQTAQTNALLAQILSEVKSLPPGIWSPVSLKCWITWCAHRMYRPSASQAAPAPVAPSAPAAPPCSSVSAWSWGARRPLSCSTMPTWTPRCQKSRKH